MPRSTRRVKKSPKIRDGQRCCWKIEHGFIFVRPAPLGQDNRPMRDEFTYIVIGKAKQVHRELGPGLDEVFYHELLSKRLGEAGIEHEFQPSGQLEHRGALADAFEADLLFPGRLVVELRCPRGAFEPEHYVQLICYLKFWRVATGLLF